MVKRLTVILKPTNACNIRCKYCYHEEFGYDNNPLAVVRLEKLLRLLATGCEEAIITWHGGEPTLMGMPYFKKAVELERQIEEENDHKVKFINFMQTNGTLINKEWIKFFKKNNFSVGVSFDGPKNDITRMESEKVMENVALMKKEGMDVTCLAVIAKPNIDQVEVYEYFKAKDLNCTFNPIMGEGAGGYNTDLLITAEEYIESSLRLFEHWVHDKSGVKMGLFESYISSCLGVQKAVCNNASCIGKWICMEPDGKLQLCSHFAGDEYSFGNVADYENMDQVFAHENVSKLLKMSINKRNICKASGCHFYSNCHGGCIYTNIRQDSLDKCGSFDCKSFQAIFGYVENFVKTVLETKADLDEFNPCVKALFLDYVSRIKE